MQYICDVEFVSHTLTVHVFWKLILSRKNKIMAREKKRIS